MRLFNWRKRTSRQQRRNQKHSSSLVQVRGLLPHLWRMLQFMAVGALLESVLLAVILYFADNLDVIRNVLYTVAIISASIAIVVSYGEVDHSKTRWTQWLKRVPLYTALLSPLAALLISASVELQRAATYPDAAYSWASKYATSETSQCDCWEAIDDPQPLEWSDPVVRVNPQYAGGDYNKVALLDKALIIFTYPDAPLVPAVYIASPGNYATSPGERLQLVSTLSNTLGGGELKFGRTKDVVGWYYDWPDEYPIGTTEIFVFKYPPPENN